MPLCRKQDDKSSLNRRHQVIRYFIWDVMDSDTQEKILMVFNKVTGDKLEQIDLDSDLKSQLSLDSIQIVELFAALEKELDIELPLKMMTVKTGRAFLEMLENQLEQ